MSRGLISYRRLVGSCSKMALDGMRRHRGFLLEVKSHAGMFPFNMSRSSKVRKFSCRVLDFRYIFLIFISRQNKLVCAQRASKKITRFVPRRVHLLEIRRIGSWNTLPTRRSGTFSSSSYFLHDKCLYLWRECSAYRWILLRACYF